MSEKIEHLKRTIKVGLLTGQTHVDRLKLYTQAKRTPVMIFLGDSRAKAWPSPEIAAHCTFLNRGIGFDTSHQVLERLPLHVAPLQPQIVLLQAGINDCKKLLLAPQNHEIMIQETLCALLQIAEQVRSTGAHLILSTIFPVQNIAAQSNAAFWGISQPKAADHIRGAVERINRGLVSLRASDVTVFDAAAVLQNQEHWLAPAYARDELHLNELGYRQLNRFLAPIVQQLIEESV